jgi:hypothetical protein
MKSTWGKIILFAIPFLILIFFYIAHQQHKQHITVKKQSLAFSRSWNEFNYQFTGKKVYQKRADKKQAELNNIRKEQAAKKKKENVKDFNKQFNANMKGLNG